MFLLPRSSLSTWVTFAALAAVPTHTAQVEHQHSLHIEAVSQAAERLRSLDLDPLQAPSQRIQSAFGNSYPPLFPLGDHALDLGQKPKLLKVSLLSHTRAKRFMPGLLYDRAQRRRSSKDKAYLLSGLSLPDEHKA